MSTSKELMVGGKPLSSLRVVDLKEELEKRGLSKSGSKKDLADRLKKNLLLENQRNIQSSTDEEQLPNLSTREQLAENPFLRDYFESQAELYHSQKVVKKLYEGMAHTPEEQQPAAAPLVEETKEKEPSPEPQIPQAVPEPQKTVQPAPLTKSLRSKAPPAVVEIAPEPVEAEVPLAQEPVVPSRSVEEPVVVTMNNKAHVEEERPSRPRRGERHVQPSAKAEPAIPQKVQEPRVPPESEEAAKPSKVEETAKPPEVEETAKPPKVDETAKPPKVEEIVKPPKVEEPVKPPKVEETAKIPKVEEPAKPPKQEEPAKPPKQEEPVKPPKMEETAKPPKVEQHVKTLEVKETIKPPEVKEPIKPPEDKDPVKPQEVQEAVKSPIVEAVEVPKSIENDLSAKMEEEPAVVEEPPKPVVEEQPKAAEPEKEMESVEDNVEEELPTPKPELQKKDRGDTPANIINAEEKSMEKPEETSDVQKIETSVEKVAEKVSTSSELHSKKDEKEEEESDKGSEEEEEDEESRADDDDEPEKSRVQKPVQSSPRRPIEEVLDYGDEESNDKKEEETGTWKRRILNRNFQPAVINDKVKPDSVDNDSVKKSSAGSSPKSLSENPEKIKTAVVRSEHMEVDEVLDYGEEESDIKKDEFVWTRRILRLKNRCSVVEKTEKKWNRGERKPVVVTSNVLEAFFPDVKPLSAAEVRLEERIPKEPEEFKESREKEAASENADAASAEGTLPNVKRKISIIPFEETVKELTPPRNPLTNILVITNLTRPFTLMQLKELLQRTGTIEDIWVDKIKSKCLAKFEKQADAEETRSALHGIKWPPSNPKALIVDFTTESEFDQVSKEPEEKKIKIEKPKEAKALPVREWDLGKRSRSRSPGRTKRSGSGDRKRARKSVSPHSRRSPHHDKKSRDHEIKEETQVKALDELFRKTTATPCLYWLPLTPEQISEKEELRRKRMVERERRLAEMEKLRPR